VERKTTACVNQDRNNNEIVASSRYLHHTDVSCHTKLFGNWTGCTCYNNDATEKLDQLTETEELLKQITENQAVTDEGKRRKRGVLNFMGELSKILFGTMDEDVAIYYNEEIKLFGQNIEDTSTSMKQRL
jgi:hypothetical protein